MSLPLSDAGGAAVAAAHTGATYYLNCDHPAVRAFASDRAGGGSARERAVRLYYAVRDEILYDPYAIALQPAEFQASRVLEVGRGFCITKAVLLAAAARAASIPARLGFADVRNHLSTERLRRLMETDLFLWHGYVELHLDGRWVKATPAFNLSLCQRFRVLPLEFDGRADSVFHPCDADGRRHMEYVHDRGSFAELPFAAIRDSFRQVYPRLVAGLPGGDFAAEAAGERSG